MVFNPQINKSMDKSATEKLLTDLQVKEYLNKVTGWQLHAGGKMIYREYLTKDFMSAVDLIRRIAHIAEEENHHPDIHLTGYRTLRIELTTHDAGGLSEKDFIEADRINDLSVELKRRDTR